MEILLALAGGAAAGFGLAAPLGAVGVLLLREGLEAGFGRAAPAAAAVAVVDTVYCALAVLGGRAAAPVISSWGAVPAAAGGAALLVLGLAGLCRARKAPAAARVPDSAVRRKFFMFLALTAINPATLLYFTALAAGLAELLSSAGAAAAFVAGVGAASGTWQLGLVGAGALLRGRTAPKLHRVLDLAGHCTVTALGAAAVLSAFR